MIRQKPEASFSWTTLRKRRGPASKEAILQLHDKVLIRFKLDLRVGRLYTFYSIAPLIVVLELWMVKNAHSLTSSRLNSLSTLLYQPTNQPPIKEHSGSGQGDSQFTQGLTKVPNSIPEHLFVAGHTHAQSQSPLSTSNPSRFRALPFGFAILFIHE